MGNYTSLVWKSSDVAPTPDNLTVAYESQNVSADSSNGNVVAVAGSSTVVAEPSVITTGSSTVVTESSVIITESSVITTGSSVITTEPSIIEPAVTDNTNDNIKNADVTKDSAVLNPSPQQSPKLNGKRKNKKGKHH
jgi:hypothetical protein